MVTLNFQGEKHELTTEDRELCPDCKRQKARNADDCVAGDCDKWYAVRDVEARNECEALAKNIDT